MRSLLLLLCGLPLILSGCGQSSSGADSAVTIGYENNGSVDPAQASLSLGLYEKNIKGTVKTVKFDSGPAALTALGSGDVDIMTGIGNPPVASAMANGVPITVIWAEELGQTDQALVVKKDSGITSIADLKGKEVATVVGSTSSYALAAVLKQHGIADSDVKLRNLDPQTILTAWTKNQIQAAYIWDPVMAKLLADGGVKLADNTDVQSVAPIYNFSVVNTKWAAAHHDAVVAFIKAQDEGVKALQSDQSGTLQVMMKDTGETSQDAQIAVTATKPFGAAAQLSPDALGPDDSHSLVATSLLAASKYLHALDPSQDEMGADGVHIDRSFVQDYLKSSAAS
ncbi:MAG: taurine ABC transporter substrate-binding protein [Marmoricola sp.]